MWDSLQPAMTICPNCGRFTPASNSNQADTDERAVPVASSAQQVPLQRRILSAQRDAPVMTMRGRIHRLLRSKLHNRIIPSRCIVIIRRPFLRRLFRQVIHRAAKNCQRGGYSSHRDGAPDYGGGIALIYYTAIAQPAQFRAQAIATVQTILTRNVGHRRLKRRPPPRLRRRHAPR